MPAAAPAATSKQLVPLDDAAAIMRGLSVIQPWGSFDVAFFPKDKLVLRTAQKAVGNASAAPAAATASATVKELVVPVSSVRAVAVLDVVPEEQAAFVLLGLKPAVVLPWASATSAATASGGNALECLALRIPNSAPPESLNFAGSPTPIQGNRAIVLCATLGKAGVPPAAFLAPDPAVFSNAFANGGCSVRAAVRASQGHLFPLGDRAIAFVKKPAFLISLKALEAAELARAGGGSASFDLLLHLKPKPPPSSSSGGGGERDRDTNAAAAAATRVLEFGQIPRQELAPLRKWLEERGVPLGASAEDGAGGKGKRKVEESDDDDEDEETSSDDGEDEDFDPKAAAAELKAQDEAEKAEEEEEEGDEEDEEEAGESESDNDSEGRPAKKNKF